MKVILNGAERTWKQECRYCKSVVEYTTADVSEKTMTMDWGEVRKTQVAVCPVCHKDIQCDFYSEPTPVAPIPVKCCNS